jgi:hypothetical protein
VHGEARCQVHGAPQAYGAPDSDGQNATLYVEGLPPGISKREVAHIFRPYEGFQARRVCSGVMHSLHPLESSLFIGVFAHFAAVVIHTLWLFLPGCTVSVCPPAQSLRLVERESVKTQGDRVTLSVCLPAQSLRLVERESVKTQGDRIVLGFAAFSSAAFAKVAMTTLQVGRAIGQAGRAGRHGDTHWLADRLT